MRILIVEDEEGIREGLASFLRHHGHVVHTAASCAAARAVCSSEALDVMVTDWRLDDGNARGLLDQRLPAIVITGCPEEIDAGHAVVLRKPVLPAALLGEIDACVDRSTERAPAAPAAPTLAELPVDARDRVHLLLEELQGSDVRIDDDGTFVTVTFRSPAASRSTPLTLRLGGDWLPVRSDTSAGPGADSELRWRCHRDGRPRGAGCVLAPDDAWPARGDFAIDLHGHRVGTAAMTRLLDRVVRVRATGRKVHLLNVPGHLRLFLELTGRAHDLPMRGSSGPILSAHQRQLWD
ncbi:MAG: response regulator [Planctomycetota bacterium]